MSSSTRYSSISIINHWVTALLVVAMLALGFTASAAPSETIEDYVLSIHIALGFFVFLFVVWRVLYRLYEGFPEYEGKTAFERLAAYIVHRAILILLVVQVVTGPMYLFTENECMDVFGWFSVCVPLESLAIIHEPMEWLHVVIGFYVLPVLLVTHLVGGIKHYLSRKQQDTSTDL